MSQRLATKVPALCAMMVKGPSGASREMRLSRSLMKSLKVGFGRVETGNGLVPLPGQSYANSVLSGLAAIIDPKMG